MDEMNSKAEHGPESAYYNNQPYQHPEIRCLCGEIVDGDTWEECGQAFDEHLLEAEVTE